MLAYLGQRSVASVPVTTLNRAQFSQFLPNEQAIRWAESLQAAASSFVSGGGGGGGLTPSGVTPGNYGDNANVGAFTVDINGIVTDAANTPIAIAFTAVSGVVPITQGGTGETTAPLAINALLPAQSAGTVGWYLQSNGTVCSWQPAPGGGGGGTVTQVDGTAGEIDGGPITVTGTLGLATTGVAAASYGSASSVAQVTFDTKGRATTASSVPISIADTQVVGLVAALALKANLASPTLTGVPAAPTAAGGTNTTQLATTAFVQSAVAGLGTITSITNFGAGLTITNPAGPSTNIDIDNAIVATVSGTQTLTNKTMSGASNTFSAIPYTAISGAVTVAARLSSSGVVVGSGTLDLAASGVTPGTYGSGTAIPVPVVDTYGRITSISTVGVSGAAGGTVSLITNTGGGLTITNPAGPTTNIDVDPVTLAPIWDYPALHGAVGAADDTATLNAMVAAAPDKATFLIPPYTAGAQGIYNTTGIVVPFEAEFHGVGMGTFKAITGATILLDFPSNSLPQDGARARYVHDMEFDGNSGTYRSGAYALKIGDATNAIVQAVMSRNFIHHFELGHWSYNTQEEQNDHNRLYRNKWGRLVQSDPTAGGATASDINHCTYQYNHVGAVYDNIAKFALATTGTLSNSSTSITSVVSTAGIALGDTVTGPGIKDGTKVDAFVANTSITLSQATTATAAMVGVPILIKRLQFTLNTTADMTNSSTALTSVASTTGIYVGFDVTGSGIQSGTTVAAFTVNTITLSLPTTPTAAGTAVPITVKNIAGFDASWTETGTTFQGNGTCAFAAWGFNLILNGCHFESNYQPGISTGTSTIPAVSARVVPVAPCYVSNSNVILANNCAGGETSTAVIAWTVVDGSTLIIRDSSIASANNILIDGDLTSNVAFYGDSNNLAGLINIPISRWPDHCNVVSGFGWGGAGNTAQVRSAAYANRNLNANPRVPVVSLSGGATQSYYRDATYGPVTAIQYAATAGGPFTHSADTTAIGTPVNAGEKMVVSRLVRADTYTTMQFQLEAGSGAFYNYQLRITPFWQRVVCSSIATTGNATAFAPVLHMFPVAADGPKVYIANDMSFIGSDDELSAILGRGLFDDATIDGALVGSATWNPGLIAAGGTATTTIAVNGLVAGDVVEVSTDIDTGALILNSWAGTNVINVRLTNPTAAGITPASMVISGRAFA